MTDRKHPTAALCITADLLAVLVAYPLSYGPVAWMYLHGWLPQGSTEVALRIYRPIEWAADESEQVEIAVDWYCGVWGDL